MVKVLVGTRMEGAETSSELGRENLRDSFTQVPRDRDSQLYPRCLHNPSFTSKVAKIR